MTRTTVSLTEPSTMNTNVEIKAQPKGLIYILFLVTLELVVIIGAPLQLWNLYAGLALTEFVLILGPAVAFVLWRGLPVVEALRLRPISGALVGLSVCVGIGGNGLVVGLLELLKPLLGESPSMEALMPKSLGELGLVLFAGAIGAGVCEEALFRAVIQGVLTRSGRWRGIIITAVLFGVFHLNPWQFVAGLVLGIAFGFMVERTGSLLPAILAHTFANATGLTLSYAFRDRADSLPAVLPWTLAVLFFVGLWQFHHRTRSVTPQPSLLETAPLPTPRILRQLALIPVALIVLLITLRVAGVVQSYRMTSEWLAPEISKGDVVIAIGARWLSPEIKPGGHIVYRSDKGATICPVVSEDNTTVVIRTRTGKQLSMPRADLLGKVVRTIHLK